MTTLAEVTRMTAECLLAPRYGTATGGSATTLIDTKLDEPDALFDGGTIWFLGGANNGLMTRITTWDQPTHTFTFDAMNAVAANDPYAVLDARYPTDQLIAAVNTALQEIGPFDKTDESLTVVADQVRYTLPAAPVTGRIYGIKRVQIATSSVEPYEWTSPHRWWKEAATELVFSDYHLPPASYAGNKIRLVYEWPHTRMTLSQSTAAITNDVNPNRVAWHAAWYAARWRNSRGDTTDAVTRGAEEVAKAQAFAMQLRHQVKRIPKDEIWIDIP